MKPLATLALIFLVIFSTTAFAFTTAPRKGAETIKVVVGPTDSMHDAVLYSNIPGTNNLLVVLVRSKDALKVHPKDTAYLYLGAHRALLDGEPVVVEGYSVFAPPGRAPTTPPGIVRT